MNDTQVEALISISSEGMQEQHDIINHQTYPHRTEVHCSKVVFNSPCYVTERMERNVNTLRDGLTAQLKVGNRLQEQSHLRSAAGVGTQRDCRQVHLVNYEGNGELTHMDHQWHPSRCHKRLDPRALHPEVPGHHQTPESLSPASQRKTSLKDWHCEHHVVQ